MTIDALVKFREKYPAYADKSDQELAGALATKFPSAYGKLPSMVAREETISGYNTGTQDSARRAEDRVNMISKLGEELAYDPMTDPRRGLTSKLLASTMKPTVTALKGLGAGGQMLEGALSSPVVAAQRGLNPLQGDFYNTIGKSISGEAPTEFGDVARNAGAPEPVAVGLGLAASAVTPGWGKIARKAGDVAKLGGTAVNKALGKSGKGLARAQLTLLARSKPEVANYALSKNLSMVKPGQSVASIESEVTNAVAKAERGARSTQRRASAIYDYGLNKAKGETILLADDKMQSITQKALAAGQEELGLTWGTKGTKLNKVPVLKGNKNIPGSETLATVIDELNQSTTTTVGKLRIRLKELEGIIEDGPKSVRAQASALASDLRKAINSQSPTMAEFNVRYKDMIKYLNPDEANKLPGVFDLLKAKSQGGTKLSNYFELPPEAKDILTKFDAALPKGRKFLEQLKDSSTNATFKEWSPRAHFSLMAPGAVLYGATRNPAFLPLMAAGGALSSPRASILMHKGLTDMVTKGSAAKVKMLSRPIGQALDILTTRGIIGPALTRGATRSAFMSPEEQEQQ